MKKKDSQEVVSVKGMSVLHNGTQCKEHLSGWYFCLCHSHAVGHDELRTSKVHSKASAGSTARGLRIGAKLIKRGAALPGADLMTPSSGSRSVTARLGHRRCPLLQGAGLLPRRSSRM